MSGKAGRRSGRPLPCSSRCQTGIDLKLANEDFGQRAKPLHDRVAYLSAVETVEKVEVSFVPRPCTTAMIATAMPAAMRPYSMAVAAVSSLKKESVRYCKLLLVPTPYIVID